MAVKQKQQENKPAGLWSRLAIPVLLFFILALLAGGALFLINRDRPGQIYSYRHMALDTVLELRLEADSKREAEAVKDQVFAEIERLEASLSRSFGGSDISRVNAAAGKEAVTVSPETISVTSAALEYAALSEGAFDPTIAPLLDRWGFLDRRYRVPGPEEIEADLPLVNYRLLELNREQQTIFLPQAGMSLDLGGIAKGFIIDRGLAILSQAGIKHAFLNAGGDIGLLGTRPDGEPWRIGVLHPREENSFMAVVPVSGGAVVTSGDYERTFEVEGVQYHHILDPATGKPATQLVSVTIVASTATEADALSTAVFVLGPSRGMALVEQLPGVEAILVTPEMEILVSSGLKDIIELP
ncbi:MAG TPA: FAD:protein FMN transferase [Bacillota bacterium]|nr:FAD:protein FMN transferase [Bacillota bacterium]